jgi:hypothetical protein
MLVYRFIFAALLLYIVVFYELRNHNPIPINSQLLEISNSKSRKICQLPNWVNENPSYLAQEMMNASMGLTDKVDTVNHAYQYMYFSYMSSMVRERYCSGISNGIDQTSRKPKIRMLEIGLGCSPLGGMIRGEPGGSALGWLHLFGSRKEDFQLHILELDEDCARKWESAHKGIAIVHVGDASSEIDLHRLTKDASSNGELSPFDIIIDDGSHINRHQIKTLEILISALRPGGFYVIEDIHSSCVNWRANLGTKTKRRSPFVGGTDDCMKTTGGEPTIFSKIVEYQKALLKRKEPFEGVNHIDVHKESVLVAKQLES